MDDLGNLIPLNAEMDLTINHYFYGSVANTYIGSTKQYVLIIQHVRSMIEQSALIQ